MAENIANKVATLLNGAIDSDDTALVVDDATGFPDANFRLLIQDTEGDDTNREIVLVTAKAGTTFTVTRAQESTTGVAHADDSYVVHVLTAGALQGLIARGTSSPVPPPQASVSRAPTATSTTSTTARAGYRPRCTPALSPTSGLLTQSQRRTSRTDRFRTPPTTSGSRRSTPTPTSPPPVPARSTGRSRAISA